jgi:hypothetical protein
MTGVERIAAERKRQEIVEGWTPEHDDKHEKGEMALAAACYAAPEEIRVKRKVSTGRGRFFPEFKNAWVDAWPWDEEWDKREKHLRIHALEISGALIAAEIDRLLRAEKVK